MSKFVIKTNNGYYKSLTAFFPNGGVAYKINECVNLDDANIFDDREEPSRYIHNLRLDSTGCFNQDGSIFDDEELSVVEVEVKVSEIDVRKQIEDFIYYGSTDFDNLLYLVKLYLKQSSDIAREGSKK